MSVKYKTGLKPSAEPPRLRFGAYFNATALPPIPEVFGHYDVIAPTSWLILGNASYSDCTIAGAMHATMLWNRIANRQVTFTEADALDDYRDACGYIIGDPSTDNGGDMVTVAKYWRDVGMRDDTGARHKIAAYLQIDAANLDHVDAACYLFGAIGLGVSLPDSAETQFDHGQPWHLVVNDLATDYHYVPCVGKAINRKVVTWGALQDAEEPWLVTNLKEAIAYISLEDMTNGKTIEGFDIAQLQSDLAALG